MAPHGTRIDIHLQTELDLEQLSNRYPFRLKPTASTATQKQTKKLRNRNFMFSAQSCRSLLKKKITDETRGKQWTKFLEGLFEML